MSAKTPIPDHFQVARYASAARQDAGWWCLQIGNRLFLRAVLRGGDTEQFRALSEQMRADPFADLGFGYRNISGATLGSRSVTTVTPLTFQRATMVSALKGRIGSANKDPCDDALAEAARSSENTDLLGFASIAHICIDLRSTDKQILSDFGLYLKRHRQKPYCPKVVRSELSTVIFSRWFTGQVLLLFDILLWAESVGLKIGPTELGERLGMGTGRGRLGLAGINAKEFYYKKALPAYKQAFDITTYQTLYTLSQRR